VSQHYLLERRKTLVAGPEEATFGILHPRVLGNLYSFDHCGQCGNELLNLQIKNTAGAVPSHGKYTELSNVNTVSRDVQ